MKKMIFRLDDTEHGAFKMLTEHAGHSMNYVLRRLIYAYNAGHIDIQSGRVITGPQGLEEVTPYDKMKVSPKRGRPVSHKPPTSDSDRASLLEAAGLPADHKFIGDDNGKA